MVGDQIDMQARLRALLPKSWFPVSSPNLDATLAGAAWALSTSYAQLTYIALQARIKTATDGWLDAISADFFGEALPRMTSETDGAFRARILANLFIKGPTRNCMSAVLTLITGRKPAIFEPSNTSDSGGLDGGLYWDAGGGWGAPMPFQSFVTAYLPIGGIVDLGEYDEYTFSWDSWGNWSEGNPTSLTDASIIAAVESTRALASIVWLRIASNPVTP